jgi:molybdopterin-containing oxidoreductase family iron-sulfur binding subunit
VEGVESPPEIPPVTVGGQPAVATFAAADFYRYVAGRWHSEIHQESDGDFADWWTRCLRQGGHFHAPDERPQTLASDLPAPTASQPIRDAHALLLFPHPFLHDGRHAHKPWMQEIPEPLSGYTWGTWAEISEHTAESLGVDATSTIEVRTEHGVLTAGVRVSKGMRDDTVAVVVGNGHKAGGRYSKDWGANATHLLSFAQKDLLSGAQSYLGPSARLAKAEADNPMYSLKGSEDMDGRPVALASAATAVIGGAGLPPGELAPEHHVPKDPRITGEGAYNMYPAPEHPNFRFGMTVDLDSCTGCGACEAACISENNIPVVGPRQHRNNRYMGWIRLDRFWEGEGEHPDVRFIPVMCQHCSHAPCEGVCPVLATYHNLDGLNAMIYNRCVGTRYCANNCPYSARRFNYHTFQWPDAYSPMLNPDVSIREMGVMEKCSFCIQRIQTVKFEHRDRDLPDAALRRLPACAETCPADAIAFGDFKNKSSEVYGKTQDPRAYTLFGELNTKPGVRYLTKVNFHEAADAHHGSEGDTPDDTHGDQGGH